MNPLDVDERLLREWAAEAVRESQLQQIREREQYTLMPLHKPVELVAPRPAVAQDNGCGTRCPSIKSRFKKRKAR